MSVRVDREPEWTPDQVSLILGVEAYGRMLGQHGHPMDEATSEDHNPDNPHGSSYYRAGIPVTDPDGVTTYAPIIDYATKAEADAMDAYRKAAGENGNVNGVFFPVQLIPRNAADSRE